MTNRSIAWACVFACATSTIARGQTFDGKIQMTQGAPGELNFETSIAVSRTNPMHFIASCKKVPPAPSNNLQTVRYGIYKPTPPVTPGETQSWVEVGELPSLVVAPGFWTDPMTAASQTTDDLFVGCLFGTSPLMTNGSAFGVWRNAAGTSTIFSTPVARMPATGFEHFEDKGLLAMGPLPDGSATRMYLGFTRREDNECDVDGPLSTFMMWRRWDPMNPASAGTSVAGQINPTGDELFFQMTGAGNPPFFNPNCDRYGWGAASAVIPSGSRRGRLVVAYAIGSGGAAFNNREYIVETCVNPNPADGMASGWAEATQMIVRTVNGVPEPIHGFSHLASIPGTAPVANFPSIAVDPSNPNVVYIAFAGHPQLFEGNDPEDKNVDLYLARSVDGGSTFDLEDRVRIPDNKLVDAGGADPAGTDQFYPAITVDYLGGINIAYLAIRPAVSGGTPQMRACYTRIGTFPPTGNLSVMPLTPPFDPPFGYGEYISIDTSSCYVYPCYFQMDGTTANVYVTRFKLCPADSDSDGAVTSYDPPTFAQQFSQQAPAADINHDGVCNGQDIEAFLNAYACACTGPQ